MEQLFSVICANLYFCKRNTQIYVKLYQYIYIYTYYVIGKSEV